MTGERVLGKKTTSFLAATFLQGVVLFITAWGGFRLWAAWRGAAWLQTIPLQVPWPYLAASGAVWLAAGVATWLMLLTGHRWASGAMAATTALFGVFWWVDRYVLAQDPVFRQNWSVALLFSVVIMATVLVITAPPVWKSLFGADDE